MGGPRGTQHRIPLAQFLALAVDLHRRPAVEHEVHLVRLPVGVGGLRLSGAEAVHVEDEPIGGEEVVLLELGFREAANVGEVLDLHGPLI